MSLRIRNVVKKGIHWNYFRTVANSHKNCSNYSTLDNFLDEISATSVIRVTSSRKYSIDVTETENSCYNTCCFFGT